MQCKSPGWSLYQALSLMEGDIWSEEFKNKKPKEVPGKHVSPPPPRASEKTPRNECDQLLGKLQEGQFGLKSSEQGEEYSPQTRCRERASSHRALKAMERIRVSSQIP